MHERLERLKRQKTAHSSEELDRLGWTRYAEIREVLEPARRGDFVMIEVDSGDYFLGQTADEALRQARAAHPDDSPIVGLPCSHPVRSASSAAAAKLISSAWRLCAFA